MPVSVKKCDANMPIWNYAALRLWYTLVLMNDPITTPLPSDKALPPVPMPQLYAVAARIALHPLTFLLLAFFCNTLLWACIIEPGRAPDEWDHFDYVRHLAITHTLPIYGQTPRVANPHVLNSEAQQPPLYYLLATPFYLLGGQTQTSQVVAVRIFSTLLGTIAVALTYALGRVLAPGRRPYALALAAIVGFNPMFTFMSAAISNDALINAIYPALLLVLCLLLRQRAIRWAWLLGLGALLGSGLLAKFSIIGGVLASGMVLVELAWRQRGRRLSALFLYGTWTVGGFLLVAGWYFARNWLLYGDPSGVLMMRTFHVNPMRSYDTIGSFWEMITTNRPGLVDFWPGVFHGFWGIFDFYIIWLARRVYYCLDVILVVGLVGSGIWAARAWLRRAARSAQARLTLALACCVITLVTLGTILNYSYRIDHQPQGRYFLPALLPLALAIVTGWEQILRLVKLQRLAAPLLMIVMLGVNWLALFTAVGPDYHNLYLATLAAEPDAPAQYVAGAFEARGGFVAEQSRIDHLEVLLDRPAGASGAIVWRLREDGATTDHSIAVEQKPIKGLGRYLIGVAQPVTAGKHYTLIVQAPWTTEDKRTLAHLPIEQSSAGDLGIQVVYPIGLSWATLRQIDYLLRAAAPGWPRGNGQRLLYLSALPLVFALAARAFSSILSRRWSPVAGVATLAVVLAALWAPPEVARDTIPSHTLLATSGPLQTLGNLPASFADLVLLAGSPQAQKQPPDDQAQRTSLIQPYRFTIGDDTRVVLAMQPPSAITYTLMLPERALLRTSIALNPQVWRPDKGDGVEFVVWIEAADGRHELLRRYIDPKSRPEDRRWNDLSIDLGAYGGQSVRLTLLALPGPAGDGRYDWTGWGQPMIVQGK
jgi:4-amino-4-deoxy-L-arabinose transferase-like glycosyltransferase